MVNYGCSLLRHFAAARRQSLLCVSKERKRCAMKKAAILLLVLITVFSAATYALAEAPTESQVYETMIAFKTQYPEGTPWGGDQYYAWNGGIFTAGTGCVAFAFMLSDAAFGELPARMITDVVFADVRPGDILRMENDTHSAIVLQVFADYAVIAEGSYNDSVHWGRILTVEDVEGSDYLLTRYPEDSGSEDSDPTDPPAEDVLASGDCGDLGLPNVKWSLSNSGEMTISGTGAMDTYNPFDPAPWQAYADRILSLTFTGEVVNVSSYGFTNCVNLATVKLTDSVVDIGVNAFAGCTALSTVSLGSGVQTIYADAFSACTALSSITLPDGLLTVHKNAFSGSGLKKVTLPDGLTYLGSSAFEQCDSLVTAYIPGSVNNNIQYVFYGCDALASVTLGQGLTAVGRYCFAECPALSTVSFPSTMGDIGESAFANTGLETLYLPDSVTILGDYAFSGCFRLESIRVPAGITEFGNQVFSYCSALQTVKLEEGLTTLGKSTFLYCKSLTGITLPQGLTTIEVYVFSETGLISIELPDGITSISKYAFERASQLQSIGWPASLTYVGSGAFDRCDSLTDVYFYGTQAQWDAVEIDSSNFVLEYANIHIMESDACAHLNTVTIPAVAPGCEEPGLTEGRMCANPACGAVIEEQRYVAPTGHSFGQWYVFGTEERRDCSNCGHYETRAYVVLGDVNGDGNINTRDAKLIMQYELGLVDETALNLQAADVNGDGSINTRDAKLIMQYELGIITQFGEKEQTVQTLVFRRKYAAAPRLTAAIL